MMVSQPKTKRPFDAAVFVATGFGVGYLPGTPGTFGAMMGVPLAWAIGQLPGAGPVSSVAVQAMVLIVLCSAGIPLCSAAAERLGGGEDPQSIIYDEIVTVPLTFFLVPWTALGALELVAALGLGFAFHRLFDISKPPPCRKAERLGGGLGIMADDFVAGFYSWLCLMTCLWVYSFFSSTTAFGS